MLFPRLELNVLFPRIKLYSKGYGLKSLFPRIGFMLGWFDNREEQLED